MPMTTVKWFADELCPYHSRRPATDPIAAAHRMRDLAAPRHLAAFQSFEAERAEWAAMHYGIVRDHAGRHLVEIGRAA